MLYFIHASQIHCNYVFPFQIKSGIFLQRRNHHMWYETILNTKYCLKNYYYFWLKLTYFHVIYVIIENTWMIGLRYRWALIELTVILHSLHYITFKDHVYTVFWYNYFTIIRYLLSVLLQLQYTHGYLILLYDWISHN